MKTSYNVLYICTGNSARSIIAEVLLNHFGQGRFSAFSAGSQPTGVINPYALEVLADHKVNIDGLRSKSWNEFSTPGAPEIDLVFTVCAKAAGESCPVWPGHPMHADWSINDPAAVQGDKARLKKPFRIL